MTVTTSDLRRTATQAAQDHLDNGTDLTAAVVKAASGRGDYTSEHVRRVCEMTYHDAFERLHKLGSGPDRYVSFEPPDAVRAAEVLRSEKIASHTRSRTMSQQGSSTHTKVASFERTRPKFAAADAFGAAIQAEPEDPSKVRWHNPVREVIHVKEALANAAKDLDARLASVARSERVEMIDLVKQASAALREGATEEDVLHACFSSPVGEDVTRRVVLGVAGDLADCMVEANHKVAGLSGIMSKTASLGEINPDHPLPKKFRKVAELRTERKHLEFALEDILRDKQDFNERVKGMLCD